MDNIHSYAPGSTELANNLVEGYQPYSRINELVHNAFIDPYEWNQMRESISKKEMEALSTHALEEVRRNGGNTGPQGELRPDFHEWATVLPGYICVSRKMRDKNWRGFVAAETAAPVIACAQGMPRGQDDQFFFSGVARSKSLKEPDDGRGPRSDDHFTMHIGGVATILNNGKVPVHPGDGVAWTFQQMVNSMAQSFTSTKRQKAGPRRIQIVKVPSTAYHPRQFGRCMSFAKPGETFDILLGPTST